MKKSIIIIALLISIASIAQSSYNESKGTSKEMKFNEWVTVSPDRDMMVCEVTTVGIKNIYYELLSVLKFYNLDFDKPYGDRGILASYVNGYTDFENIALSCRVSDSEIKRIYKCDGYIIFFMATTKAVSLSILRNKE